MKTLRGQIVIGLDIPSIYKTRESLTRLIKGKFELEQDPNIVIIDTYKFNVPSAIFRIS